jgi:hypothetical protein
LGKTPCARCAKKKADEAARKLKEKAEWEFNHPCDICSKDKKDREESVIPRPVNATHHEVPVTEEVEKTAIIKDDKTGKETEIKVKVPETKMRIIPKVPPVAQNSTHEIVPVTDIEEKEVPVPDAKSGKIKKVIEKVPVTKNKVIPKTRGADNYRSTPTVEAPLEGTAAVTPVAGNVSPGVFGMTLFLVTGTFSITFFILPDFASGTGTSFSSISVTGTISWVEFYATGGTLGIILIFVSGTLTFISVSFPVLSSLIIAVFSTSSVTGTS